MSSRAISFFLVLVLLAFPPLHGAAAQHDGAGSKPRLVVLLALDGLRADLLDRYDAAFTGGFHRLRHEGVRFTNAWVDHAVTVSHAGHVTLATGDWPSHHGIVDAGFYVPRGSTRVLVDAVEDSTESIVGVPGSRGYSPRHVLVPGIAEWTRSADPAARTLAVGTGNISSLLHSFRPGDVYWYRAGRYVTSTYYRSSYPEWVQRFNESILPPLIKQSRHWSNSIPKSFRSLARPDSASYEADGVHVAFPHFFEHDMRDTTKAPIERYEAYWFSQTPFIDLATLRLAEEGVKANKLGTRGTTDYLSIVLSETDNMSHYYGPMSQEMFDVLVRLDKAIGAFMKFLDETVGKGEYVLALSADHGFPEVPEYRKQQGKPGERIREDQIEQVLSAVDSLVGKDPYTSPRVAHRVAEFVRTLPFVAQAYEPSELAGTGVSTDPMLNLFRHSFRTDRIPRLPFFSLKTFTSSIARAGVMMRLKEGTMINLDVVIHGSPYDYDRHVPMIFFGKRVDPGVRTDPARTIDIAPTLATLAGIPIPVPVDGSAVLQPK